MVLSHALLITTGSWRIGFQGELGIPETAKRAMQAELETERVTKVFGTQYALNGVDLRLEQGDCLVLIGPNGAGKTTLLRCLAGLSRPSAGRVLFRGQELTTSAGELRRHIGFLSHETLLYDDLTPAENLRFYGRMYDVPRLPERVAELLDGLGLAHRRDDPVRTLSRGMRQRLSLARALIHEPSVVLLDEPYTGLDMQAAESLDAVLRDMASSGQTVLLTTHDLPTAARIGSQLAVLVEGCIVYQASEGGRTEGALRDVYRSLIGATR
jgi:heme ABC exporter ATP-binding subunit CcmA